MAGGGGAAALPPPKGLQRRRRCLPSAAGLDFIAWVLNFNGKTGLSPASSHHHGAGPDPPPPPFPRGTGLKWLKAGRELRQLPEMMVFRLAGFPGVVLSKQEGREGPGACP